MITSTKRQWTFRSAFIFYVFRPFPSLCNYLYLLLSSSSFSTNYRGLCLSFSVKETLLCIYIVYLLARFIFAYKQNYEQNKFLNNFWCSEHFRHITALCCEFLFFYTLITSTVSSVFDRLFYCLFNISTSIIL